MSTTKLQSASSKKLQSPLFEEYKSTSFDDEVLVYWGERARMQISAMDTVAAYFD